MKKRKSLSVRTRFEVFKRDLFTCQYCGKHPPDVLLVVDHIIPVVAGGSNEPSNLRTSCQPCNGGKSDGLLLEGEFPAPSAKAIADQAERLRQAKAYAKLVEEMREHDDDRVGMVIDAWAKAFQAQTVIKDGERFWQLRAGDDFPSKASIRRYLKHLSLEDVLEAVDIAAAKKERGGYDAHRYFFGVCRNKQVVLESAPRPAAPRPRELADDPPSAVVQRPREFRDDSPSDFEESELAETAWTPCTPFVCSLTGSPANYPDWWDYKRGLPPGRWLESPVEYQEQRAWHCAYELQKADPDAREQPQPFLNDNAHEPSIRNPEWVRYWTKYNYYPEWVEDIRMSWGPEGVGCHRCVPRREEEPSHAEKVRIGNGFVAQLRANARSPGTPLRVDSSQYSALIQVLDQEDIFLDKGTAYIGMRVWINDRVIAAIEAVYENDYIATAYYVNADEWTPPGMSLAAYEASTRQVG